MTSNTIPQSRVPGRSDPHAVLPYAAAISVIIPILDGDVDRYLKFGHCLKTWERRERRIVANLIAHLERHGFECREVDDGGDTNERVNGMKEIMEAAFAVRDAELIFLPVGVETNVRYRIELTFNNGNEGMDVINDYSEDGRFGFAMANFNVEDWA